MRRLKMPEIDQVDGGTSGSAFPGAVGAGAGAVIAISMAAAWGAVVGLLALGPITINAPDRFSQE